MFKEATSDLTSVIFFCIDSICSFRQEYVAMLAICNS